MNGETSKQTILGTPNLKYYIISNLLKATRNTSSELTERTNKQTTLGIFCPKYYIIYNPLNAKRKTNKRTNKLTNNTWNI